jgi:hypothetical protein
LNIDEDEAEAPINNETIVTIVHPVRRRMRPKLVQFWENRRPAYWGTWRKSSNTVGPRRPFGKEVYTIRKTKLMKQIIYSIITIDHIRLRCRF